MIIFPLALLKAINLILFQLGKISSMFQFVLQVQPTSLTVAAEEGQGSGLAG